ncbi:hypothetical protein [Paenibacillus thalictri]|nr:hypothetical protein [Paenibacillus thalictri]
MNYVKYVGIGALAAVLITGCGEKPAAQPASAADGAAAQQTGQMGSSGQAQASSQSQPNQAGQPNQQAAQSGGINDKERQMGMTFQNLLMMDKADGLTITKQQAEYMLPVVQDGITKKELSSDAETKLTEKLTAEQKPFLSDRASTRAQGQGGPQQGGSGQTGSQGNQGQGEPQGNNQGQNRGQDRPTGNSGSGQQQNAPAQGADRTQGGEGKSPVQGGGKGGNPGQPGDRGQQLVELLQSKLK